MAAVVVPLLQAVDAELVVDAELDAVEAELGLLQVVDAAVERELEADVLAALLVPP
jgi:hypothetical protein